MIKIAQAQAGQSTTNGIDGPWLVTLDGEELYSLPSHFTVQETFLVRDIVEKMMGLEGAAVKKQEQELSLVKMQHIVSRGDAKLEALVRENERLADALQQAQEVA